MFKKTTFIITIIFILSDLNGSTRELHPAVKSGLFPGWGEISLSKPKQSRFFILLELTLWSSCIGLYQFSNHKKMQYQSYAAEYAGVNPENKNHKYWGGKNLFELYSEAYTPWEWHEKIINYCNEKSILCFSSPFDESAVEFLEQFQLPAYKIASFENMQKAQPQEVMQPRRPSINPFGLANLFMNMRRF